MRPSAPLPLRLSAAPFTVYEARAASLSAARLRSSDLSTAGRLLYLPAGWDFELRGLSRALSAATPGAWISHVTAAVLLGLWLPSWFRGCRELHLSKPKVLPPVRRQGVVGHTVLAFDDEVMDWDGIRISTPARTWLDLARLLPLEDLVAVGDQLLRQPRPGLEERVEPWATVPDLKAMLQRHPKLQGIVKARLAAELIRPGADSAPETFLRLALTAAGLPEPELQLRITAEDPFSPAADLGYRAQRVAIQYDGGHHLTREQQSRDNRRDETFNAAGWRYFKFNADDLADDFRGAVRRVSAALHAR
ncbi:endonuclease domain-containing protein [Arthrobacter sp. NPDC058130]|uniref:endonuclease domain-containing protein n=1 Tax=Arthrobacter sp. NPDC058130 TaxID=3346353 RepID=UPI0036ED0977